LAIIIAFLTVFLGIYMLAIYLLFGDLIDESVSKEDLIENYELKKNEIQEIKKFIDSKIPSKTYLSIEFKNNQIEILHLKKNDIYENNWNIPINSKKIDSILSEIGWTKTDLKNLKHKLHNANCISVSSGSPLTIGWQRSGMGKYFYKIFDQNLNDSIKALYDEGCNYDYYKDNIVLEYGGGAFGRQCFSDYYAEK
jgi:hypothetical protein